MVATKSLEAASILKLWVAAGDKAGHLGYSRAADAAVWDWVVEVSAVAATAVVATAVVATEAAATAEEDWALGFQQPSRRCTVFRIHIFAGCKSCSFQRC